MGDIYTIPASHGFAQALVQGLLNGTDPITLAKTEVYLPTRRAVRTVQMAFRDLAAENTLILPRLTAVGDMDADELALSGQEQIGHTALNIPPAMSPAHRLFLLARLVDHAWDQVLGSASSPPSSAPPSSPSSSKSMVQVFAYARALMSLLDAVETEGLDLSVLSAAAPQDPDLEGFWERAGRFIALVQDVWPQIEAETGRISVARQRRLLLELQAEEWRQSPPDHPLILAGTTASIPVVSDMAEVIMSLPQGQIILPGLDPHLDVETWDLVTKAPSHPQHGMACLLQKLNISPTDVALWPGCAGTLNQDRHAAISMAQRPVGASHRRVSAPFDLSDLALVEAPSPELEARSLALFLREALATPTATAALVTPDQDLAGRVKAELRRWGIEVDDSAGTSWLDSPVGRLVQISGRCLGQAIESLSLTALLTHPLVTTAPLSTPPQSTSPLSTPSQSTAQARAPKASLIKGLGQALDLATRGIGTLQEPDQIEWPDHPFTSPFQEFWAQAPKDETLRDQTLGDQTLGDQALKDQAPGAKVPLPQWVDRHLDLLNLLSPDMESLWDGPAGEGLANLFEDLHAYGAILPPLTLEEYGHLLDGQLISGTYRHLYGTHPRIAILGTLEARLLRVDALALGGLNEGTWPKETDVGPWMNRPTRALVGLPSPERKVGLAAHDLAQAFGSGRVLMSRTTRVDGTPTLSSRWIERLKTLLIQTGQQGALDSAGQIYLNWAQALDQGTEASVGARAKASPEYISGEASGTIAGTISETGLAPLSAPARACPPTTARPQSLHATDVGLLVTNPYGFYAKRILRLRALPPRGPQSPEQTWGILIHDILEQAIKQGVTDLGALVQLGAQRLNALDLDPGTQTLWRAQLTHCLSQFWQLNHPYAGHRTGTEVQGAMHIGGVTIQGRADRLILLPDQLHVLDYKTGTVATEKDQTRGVDPQLAILGLIAADGGFEDFKGQTVAQVFFDLPKRVQDKGERKDFDEDVRAQVREGLETLLTAYAKADQPYLCAPFGDKVGRADPKYDEYFHLARRTLS